MKNIFVSRRISCILRPTLQSKKNNKKYTVYRERYVCGRVCYFESQMFRASTVVRVARIVAPAGVGGAQFIRNNYYGDNRNASVFGTRASRGSLFRGADVSTLINRSAFVM